MPYRNYFLAAIIIDVVVLLLLLILKNFLPPLAPLFYGKPIGEAQLTTTFGLMIAPLVSILITVINLVLSLWLSDDFFRKLLAISAVVVSVLLTITILKIVLLVGFF